MKLHHLDNNGKQSFAKKYCLTSYIGNSEHLRSVTTEQKSGPDDSFGGIKYSSDDSQTNQPAKLNYFSNKLTPLYDRVGRVHLHDFTGVTCVIGDDIEALEEFSNQLLTMFKSKGQGEASVITAKEFSIKESKRADKPLLIKTHIQTTPLRLLKEIIKHCSTICILKIQGNKIACGLKGKVKSSRFSKRIIDSLGGNLHLRELMIASLAEDEFLLIENTPIDQRYSKGTVRCFQTIIKHHAESISQIW